MAYIYDPKKDIIDTSTTTAKTSAPTAPITDVKDTTKDYYQIPTVGEKEAIAPTPDTQGVWTDTTQDEFGNPITVAQANESSVPSLTLPTANGSAPTPTTVGGTETSGISDTGLLNSLRRGILTGAQVSSGAKTFGGGKSPDGRANRNAARLRIGESRIDAGARSEIKRKKQTNTLGLNLGSSVGLQV